MKEKTAWNVTVILFLGMLGLAWLIGLILWRATGM
jgi:hypothetical protein